MTLVAQKEWIPPPGKDQRLFSFFFLLKKDGKQKEMRREKKAGGVRRMMIKKGKLYPYKMTKKKYISQQITCKIKIRQARIRFLKSEFAKYD